jgi:hypothetical protein
VLAMTAAAMLGVGRFAGDRDDLTGGRGAFPPALSVAGIVEPGLRDELRARAAAGLRSGRHLPGDGVRGFGDVDGERTPVQARTLGTHARGRR